MQKLGDPGKLASSGRTSTPYKNRYYVLEIAKFLRVERKELAAYMAAHCAVHRSWDWPYRNEVYWVTERDLRKIIMHFGALHGAFALGGWRERVALKKKLGEPTLPDAKKGRKKLNPPGRDRNPKSPR